MYNVNFFSTHILTENNILRWSVFKKFNTFFEISVYQNCTRIYILRRGSRYVPKVPYRNVCMPLSWNFPWINVENPD